MTVSERRLIDREVLLLTDNTYNLTSLMSDRDVEFYLARVKRTYPDSANAGHCKLAAEDVVEFAIGVGLISLEEEFAN
jgi:hypothetical protein